MIVAKVKSGFVCGDSCNAVRGLRFACGREFMTKERYKIITLLIFGIVAITGDFPAEQQCSYCRAKKGLEEDTIMPPDSDRWR